MKRAFKVLIAYDGSPGADIAIQDLRNSGLSDESESLVLTVLGQDLSVSTHSILLHDPSRQSGPGNAVAYEQVVDGRDVENEGARKVKLIFPAWRVKRLSSYGSPAEQILTESRAWGADLVVLGSHGHSALGRLILGSVAQKVVREADCSIRISRHDARKPVRTSSSVSTLSAGDKRRRSARLVVGFDGSFEASLAVREIAQRSWPLDTEVKVIGVERAIAPHPIRRRIPSGPLAEETEIERVWLRNAVDAARRELNEGGLANVSGAVLLGDPGQVLADEARLWGADCIFVGARGQGLIERFLLGSVPSSLAAHASCTLEVVRDHRNAGQP